MTVSQSVSLSGGDVAAREETEVAAGLIYNQNNKETNYRSWEIITKLRSSVHPVHEEGSVCKISFLLLLSNKEREKEVTASSSRCLSRRNIASSRLTPDEKHVNLIYHLYTQKPTSA